MPEYKEITISGFELFPHSKSSNWCLAPGSFHVLDSKSPNSIIALTDYLAGSGNVRGLQMESDGVKLRSLPSAALLPPPGKEVFTGTSIGEQIDFHAGSRDGAQKLLTSLDRQFGFGFGAMADRSVWELGAGERRCLLLVSQALASPGSWIMHNPLASLDGPRQRALAGFVVSFLAAGGVLVCASGRRTHPLFEHARLLVLGKTARELLYQGSAWEAGGYD